MRNKKFGLSAILAIVIGVLVLALDLITKYVITAGMPHEGMMADFLPGFINVVIVFNTGAGFGILAGRPIFLIVLTIILITVFILFFVMKHVKGEQPVSVLLGVAAGFVVGGCFGNLYDRLVFGYVRDFLNFQFMNFPVFNVADICLCVGIALLVVYFLFIMPKENKKGEKSDEK